jgi:hypothetical protein
VLCLVLRLCGADGSSTLSPFSNATDDASETPRGGAGVGLHGATGISRGNSANEAGAGAGAGAGVGAGADGSVIGAHAVPPTPKRLPLTKVRS